MTTYQKILSVFGLTLGLITLVMVWALVLNKGTLIVEGDAPFIVNYGKSRSVNCLENKCEYKIPAGKYTITAYKDNYVSDEIAVKVGFRSEINWSPKFSFIPQVIQLGQRNYLNLPETSYSYEQNLSDVSFLLPKTIDIENIEFEFEDIYFNSDGSSALISADQQYWIWNHNLSKLKKLTENKLSAKAWDKANKLYYLEQGQNDESLLKKFNVSENSELIISKFLKDPGSLTMTVSPSGQWIVLMEKSSPNNWYLINTEDQSRHKIDQPELLTNPQLLSWSSNENYLMLNQGSANWLFEPKLETFRELRAMDLAKILAYEDQQFILVQKTSSFLGEGSKNSLSLNLTNSINEFNLYTFDVETNSYEEKTVKLNQKLAIENYEIQDDLVHFLADETIYQVLLEEK